MVQFLRELDIALLSSGGQRNKFAQFLCRATELQGLSRTLIEPKRDLVKVCLGVLGEIRLPRQVLPKQSVGVLVRSPLPRAPRVAEVDVHVGRDRKVPVLSHL